MGGQLENTAKLADMDIEGAGLHLRVQAPNALQQVRAGQKSTPVAKQHHGQLELPLRELHRFALELDWTGHGIKHLRRHRQLRGWRQAVHPAHQSAQTGQQLAGTGWFYQKIVGAVTQGFDDVLLGIAAG